MVNNPDLFDGTPNQERSLNMNDALSLLETETPAEDKVDVEEEKEVETTEEVKEEVEEETSAETSEEVETESDSEITEEQDVEEVQESFTLQLDGKEMTPEEIQKEWDSRGLRQSDYTRKTQEVAELRRTFEAEMQQTQATQQALSKALQNAEQILGDANKTEPDWANLSQRLDPRQFNQVKSHWETNQKQLADVREQRRLVAEKEAQDNEILRQQNLLREQSQLLEYFPKWKDNTVRTSEVANLRNYMLEDGLPEQVIEALNSNGSAKAIQYIYKAMKYDELQKSKPLIKKKVLNKPRVSSGGTPTTRKDNVSANRKNAFSKFNKSGSIDDAVNFILTQ